MPTDDVALLPCPFCGHEVKHDLVDTLHPTGTVWREIPGADGMRSYHRHREKQDGDGDVWCVHCPTPSGGCSAQVHADSKAEVIAAWNTRAAIPPSAPGRETE